MNLNNWIDLSAFLGDFHFLRPGFLWGVPVAIILGVFLVLKRGNTRWEDLIPATMLEALRVTGGRTGNAWKWLAPLCLILGSLAASGPTWTKIPVPTSTAQSALVILLDLSPSMLATDVAPDRLTRVKYKLIDILRAREDGQTALIAYSGSPHRVAPLTDDTRTIEALLPALHPTMMPVQGSDTESAVDLAIEMLQSSGRSTADILLITDGVAPEAQRTIKDRLGSQYRLLILGVGSTEAVPIPKIGGGFISDSRGEIVLTELNRDELQILAGFHRGRYVEMQTDDSDIRYLLQDQEAFAMQSGQTQETTYDSWEDVGYYLLLLLLPIAAYSFRRGVIFCLPLVVFLVPQESQAFEWADLWKTPNQQAAQALEEGDAATAAEKFEQPEWSGYAHYRDGEYEAASEKLANQSDPISHYNLGNSLALKGDLEDALEAYEKALALDPDLEDAQYNKEVIEKLLEQQQEQEQQQEGESEDSEQPQDSEQSENSEPSESEQRDSQNSDAETEDGEASQEENEAEESEQENQANSEEEQSTEPEERQEQESELPQPSEETSEEEQEQQADAKITPLEETPEQMDPASEQWLRGIPDDPSGLLREKFEYQSDVYQREQRFLRAPPGTTQEERY